MTTISNVNIVVQQEGGAREAQNIRHAVENHNQLASADQEEKDIQRQTTVQQSDQSERTRTEKDPSKKRKQKRKDRRLRQGTADTPEQKGCSDGAGKLVNTIA